MWSRMQTLFLVALCLGAGTGCEDAGKKSAQAAKEHAKFVATAARQDVEEVKSGLPQGAKILAEVYEQAHPELPSAEAARKGLAAARSNVQDLRVAKSTFFLAAGPDGRILRNDQETDEMAGKNLLEAFPELKQVKEKGYVETIGSMKEASGVRGREDAQWVAAVPVRGKDQILGLYATGWSWSAYAYRLETGLRSDVLADTESGDKVPLLYVYVIVGKEAYGAPVAPTVNADAILKLDPLAKVQAEEIFTAPLEIEGRKFGAAMQRIPELGNDVALAVLRSET